MTYYERNLPHWHPEGASIFLTGRLFGSLPASCRPVAPPSAGHAFRAMDRELDRAALGPQWLKDPRIAVVVVEALRFAEQQLGLYQLHAYVVMPNHVHVLLCPQSPLARITKSLKGFTARSANQILGRTGSPFWQYESYDHWVRDDREHRRILAYIERNPVMAGLASKVEDWPWSSARGLMAQ
jgi:putative transposase